MNKAFGLFFAGLIPLNMYAIAIHMRAGHGGWVVFNFALLLYNLYQSKRYFSLNKQEVK